METPGGQKKMKIIDTKNGLDYTVIKSVILGGVAGKIVLELPENKQYFVPNKAIGKGREFKVIEE